MAELSACDRRTTMRFLFSIVIICKNEKDSIARTLESVQALSDDIVVYDSGSTDGTIEIVKSFDVKLHTGPWLGFGATRQQAALLSKYDWVLVVDGDEVVTPALGKELLSLQLINPEEAYRIELYNHLGTRRIRYGTWGKDFRIRLYHKDRMAWTPKIVHETLEGSAARFIDLEHPILHYTASSFAALTRKMNAYAKLTGEQYYRSGKKSSLLKRSFGPIFTFLKSYVLKLGFLDGAAGYRLASLLARYTQQKYAHLHRLWKENS